MGFDLSTAQPVQAPSFDLSTARPVAPSVRQFDAVGGKMVPVGSPADIASQSPVSGNSGLKNFTIGAGKGAMDMLRGIGQDMGLVSRQDVSNSRALDKPIMGTSAGKWGDMAGTIGTLAPTMLIPGANTIAGATAIGAGTGLAAPSTSTGETLRNVGFGAASGPAAIGVGRAAGSLFQGGKALLEPFFAGGQKNIAARSLQAFAGTPEQAAAAAQALRSAPATLPGVQPTTAELANNTGLAQLERTLRNQNAAAFGERDAANRGAMVNALSDMAGTPAQAQFAQNTRSALTSPLYQEAQNITVPADAELGSLLSRPSMSKAWDRAQALAAENGEQLRAPNANDISGKTLQYLKMGLNDIADTAEQKGMGAHEQNAVNNTLAAFNKWTMKNVPQLRAADRSFAELSQPLNQMNVAGQLQKSLVPALDNFGVGTSGLNANSYARAVANGDQLAQRATGMGNSTLANTLRPDQMRTVNQVGEQLARRVNAANLGRGPGSNTAQNLAAANVLRQFWGPTGLPQSWGEKLAQSTIGQTLGRPMEWAAKAGEGNIQGLLEHAALNPQEAAGLLQHAQMPSKVGRALVRRQGLLGVLPQSLIYSSQQ